MDLREELNQFSKWAGIVAVFTIIFGALSALSGVFVFIIGAVPGVLLIIIGVKLLNAKRDADEIIYDKTGEAEGKMQSLISNLTTYFKIQGILYIISIVFFILGIIVMIFVGAQFYPQF